MNKERKDRGERGEGRKLMLTNLNKSSNTRKADDAYRAPLIVNILYVTLSRPQVAQIFGQTIFFNCQREMYINIHAKHSSLLHYCYVTQFYSLWDSIIAEVIVGICQIFFTVKSSSLKWFGSEIGARMFNYRPNFCIY